MKPHPLTLIIYPPDVLLPAQMATLLATDLGISEESLPQLTRVSDLHGARMLQSTWQGIQMLERPLLAPALVAFSNSGLHQSSLSATGTNSQTTNRSILSMW